MRADDLEVSISMRDGDIKPQRHGRHSEIDQTAHCVTATTTAPMDGRGVFGVRHHRQRLDVKVCLSTRAETAATA